MKKTKKNKNWDVTIRATVTKTLRIKADTEDEATEEAHRLFSVLNTDNNEKYEEETVSVQKVP